MRGIGRSLAAVALLGSGAPLLAQSATAGQPRAPDAAVPAVLGEAERRSVVETIAASMEARYADRAGGAQLAQKLRRRLAAGAYDRLVAPAELAATLTADLRATVQDKHLRVMYEPNRAPTAGRRVVVPAGGAGGGPPATARVDPRSDAQLARANFGFDRAERLPGNVGYLKLSQFVPLATSEATASAAMAFLGNVDGMIVDLRGVPGGSPDLVARLVSYFTAAEPMTLMTTYMRAMDAREELRTVAQLPSRRLTGKPLFVLIDERTASAAEMFAYFVQRHKLGTLVGATTSGAGLGGAVVPAGSGIYFFLPQIQITDGPGWERAGIVPEIKVAPARALDTANAMILERLAAADTDEQARRERLWALEIMPASALTGNLPPLSGYAGRYGTRVLQIADGALVDATPGAVRSPLIRVAADVFRTPTVRLTFERTAAGTVTAVRRETIDGISAKLPRTPG